jgi:hypothetical protein
VEERIVISRHITPKRTGRRYITALAATGLLASLLLAGGTALAVHDAGLFELDGNAVNGAATGDDWDNVCHQIVGSDCSTTSNTTGAVAVAWVAEPDTSASIFTGGGSKDPIDISSWAWKNAGGLPDKDNLTHGFAARYQTTPSATCPAGTATTCDILYFGSDRYDNSGDAQQGFWFFQNRITADGPKSGGGFGFTGVHRNGDLLIISDFSNGGTVSTITIYKWNSAVSGNLELLLTSDAANCATAAATDQACGLVNANNGTTAPWPFLDKSGNTTYLQGELYEGGVNLSLLGLSNECFSSVASETRSSTSTTATLKDFVLGQLANCSATLATAASLSSVNPGVSVTDTATVTGSSPSVPPTGNVTFFLCSAVAAGGDCSANGAQVGSSVPLTGAGAARTATSDAVNTAANPLAPGHYCFRAEWPGDANYVGALSHTNSTTECFDVVQSGTTTTTTPMSGGGAVTTVSYGASVSDYARVNGATGFGDPTGSVDFFICSPSQVTGTGASARCAAGTGSAVSTETLTPIAGSSPPATEATSDPVTANALGVWCFRAVYTPATANYTGSNDSSNGECFSVTTTSSGTSAQRWLPNDRIVVTSVGTSLAGTLTVSLRTGSCTGSIVYTDANAIVFTATTSGAVYNTNNTTFFVGTKADGTAGLAAGTYYWSATFTPNSTFATGTTTCENSVVTINN